MTETYSPQEAEPHGPGRSRRGLAGRLASLGGASLAIAVSDATARAIGLATAFVAAALLRPEAMGEFALLSVSAAFVGSMGVLGFGPLLTRGIASAATRADGRALTTFVLVTSASIMAVVGCGLALAVDPAVDLIDLPGVDTRGAAILIAVWGLGLGLNPLLVAVAAGYRSFGRCSAINVSRAVLVGAGTLLGCSIGDGAGAAAAGAATAEIAMVAIVCAAWWRSSWLAMRDQRRHPRRSELLRQAIAAGAASIAIQFALWLGFVLLSRADDGVVAAGAFLLTTRLVLIVTIIPSSLAVTSLPSLADPRLSRSVRLRMRRRTVWWGLVWSVPTAVVMAVFATVALPFIDDAYADYRPMMLVMALVGIASAANTVQSSLAVAEQRIAAWIWSDWLLAAVLVGVALTTVTSRGAEALAVAHLAAYSASTLLLVGHRYSRSRR